MKEKARTRIGVILVLLFWGVLALIEWTIEGDDFMDPGSCAICGRSNPEDYVATVNGEEWCYLCYGSYCTECKKRSDRIYGGRCLDCIEGK
ncbi:MAG: hypothetical protein IJ438_06150 [Clostridia bacterium]|nr:hypothetical protein [Clostridia bacterium]